MITTQNFLLMELIKFQIIKSNYYCLTRYLNIVGVFNFLNCYRFQCFHMFSSWNVSLNGKLFFNHDFNIRKFYINKLINLYPHIPIFKIFLKYTQKLENRYTPYISLTIRMRIQCFYVLLNVYDWYRYIVINTDIYKEKHLSISIEGIGPKKNIEF